jgi:outer membrane murein-binding lipoprotein Lpp
MKKIFLFVCLGIGILLCGCGSSSETKQKQQNSDLDKNLQQPISQKNTDAEALRKKAKAAGSASRIMGYDGKRIDKDLNTIIDKSEDLKSQYKDFGLD